MDLTRLTLSGPDATIASLPYLLGFTPEESAVVLWLEDGRLGLTQRLDLPAPGGLEPWLDAVWGHAAAATSTDVIVVIVTRETVAAWLVDAIVDRADRQGMSILDLLVTDGTSWRSLLCSGSECCPAQGRRVETSSALRIAAEFAAAGRAPVPSRADIVREFAPDPRAGELVGARMVRPPSSGAAREEWRDTRIATVLALLTSPADSPPEPGQAAEVSAGLADIRVRDTVLWELSRSADEPRVLDRLSSIVRSCPDGHVAPVATTAAVVAWCMGDGARARVALERALGDDPGYSLARLVAQALDAGLPPRRWQESMRILTRDECRRAG